MNVLKGMKVFDIDLYALRSRDFHADMIADRGKMLKNFGHCLRKENEFVCPLCGGRDKTLELSYGQYRLYRCAKCSCVAPNVDPERLEEAGFYQSDIVVEDVKREIVSTFEYRKATFGRERIAYLKELIPGFGQDGMEVLDVGCGPGYFLAALEEAGITGRGLEVNPACVNYARSKGLDVVSGLVADEPESRYSLVTMFDVIEHLANPIRFLTECATVMKPGGFLLAYSPNIESLSIQLMDAEHNMIAPFNHLCFYTPASLEYLSKKVGLTIHRIEYFGLDVIDYLGMRESETGHSYFGDLRPMVGPLQAVLDHAGLSNCMRIIFRKD